MAAIEDLDIRGLATTMARHLFPPGAVIVERASEVPPHRRYVVLAANAGPRWFLPAFRSASPATLALWRPYRLTHRLAWRAVRLIHELGMASRLLGPLPSFGVAANDDWSSLGVHDFAPVPVVYVGTPSRVRKFVAFLAPPDGSRAPLVAKTPIGVDAAESIVREANVLKRLNKLIPGVAPDLHHVDPAAGRSVQSTVPGRPLGRRFREEVLTTLIGLRMDGSTVSLASLAEDLEKLSHRLDISRGDRDPILARLDEIRDDRLVPAVWIHGDFTPWNLRCSEDGRMTAVDWENAAYPGHPLHDLIHFFLMQDFLFGTRRLGGRSYQRAAQEYLKRLDIPESMHDSLAELAAIREWLEAVARGSVGYAGRDFPVERIVRRICHA